MAKIRIIRKKIKNIYIRIDKNGVPYITMPKYADENEALRFYEENIGRVEKMIKNAEKFSHSDFLSKGKISVFGQEKRLRISVGGENFVREYEDEFIVGTASGADDDIRKSTEKYLKSTLSQVIGEYLSKWETLTGLRSNGYAIRKTYSRWGSCNCTSGKLNFSLFLANTALKCVSYVVLHEVCHLKYANHGVGFKKMLDKFMPEWRVVRKELNEVYAAMRFE